MSCECSLSPLLKSQDICLYLTRLPSSMARLSETSEAEINVAGVNQGGQSGTKWDKYGALFTSFLSQKILKVPRLFPENSKMCPIKIPDFPQKSHISGQSEPIFWPSVWSVAWKSRVISSCRYLCVWPLTSILRHHWHLRDATDTLSHQVLVCQI